MTYTAAKRALTAIVFVDVVGYSRLMGEDEAGTLELMRRRRSEVIVPLIANYRGRLVNAAGDSFLMEFSSVVEATEFAIATQQRNAERNADTPDARKLEFRIGVNLGDVIVRDGAVFGDSVNIAARLQALAEPSGVCLSAAAYDQVRGKVDAEFVDQGAHQVKNIARAVEVFALSPEAIQSAPRPHFTRPGRPWIWRVAAVGLGIILCAAIAGVFTWRSLEPSDNFAADLNRLLAQTQATRSEDARAKLIAGYFAMHLHRALAIALRAQGHWSTGDWPNDETAGESALEQCQIVFNEACQLAAVDERMISDAARGAMDMPRVRYEGAFDPTRLPAVRSTVMRRKDVTDYRAAKAPKAAALHPRGVLTVVLSADTQRGAEEQALKLCNDEAGRSSDLPCFLYASGDAVVLPRRATAAITAKP